MGLTTIGFNGDVQPAIFLTFQVGEKAAGAPPNALADFVYAVRNPLIVGFDIVAKTPAGDRVIKRQAKANQPLYDAALNTYVTDPVPARALNDIIDAHNGGNLSITITLKVTYLQFFFQLLRYMTRQDADLRNLADPASSDEILKTFDHTVVKDKGHVTHKKAEPPLEIKDLPCKLTGGNVTAAPKGKPPAVKLNIDMKVKDLPKEARTRAAQILLAADYSKIYEHAGHMGTQKNDRTSSSKAWWVLQSKKPPEEPKGIEASMMTWEKNLINYLWSYADLDRGKKIFDDIVGIGVSAVGKTPTDQKAPIREIRKQIDAYLVTANHWTDNREDRQLEPYQAKLADVFGAIHQERWSASPVRLLRWLTDIDEELWEQKKKRLAFQQVSFWPNNIHTLSQRQVAYLTLQWATGHCAEHADLSYEIMKEVMQDAKAKTLFKFAIHVANANIDHEFVIGGFAPKEILLTKASQAGSAVTAGSNLRVVDLTDMLAKNSPELGYVLDAYLTPLRKNPDGTVFGEVWTVKDLDSRLRAYSLPGLRTHYVRHFSTFPVIGAAPKATEEEPDLPKVPHPKLDGC